MSKKFSSCCQNIATGSSFLAALFHFVCCGGTILSALLNTSALLPKQTFLTHGQMGYMLIFSGILLLFSIYIAQKNHCDNDKNKISFCRWVLYLSLILYAVAVLGHFNSGMATHDMMIH